MGEAALAIALGWVEGLAGLMRRARLVGSRVEGRWLRIRIALGGERNGREWSVALGSLAILDGVTFTWHAWGWRSEP